MYVSENERAGDLRRLGKQRVRLRRSLAQNIADIAAAVRDAHAADVPKAEIARLVQISRVTLDAMLKDD